MKTFGGIQTRDFISSPVIPSESRRDLLGIVFLVPCRVLPPASWHPHRPPATAWICRLANDVYYLIRCDETVLILQRQLTVLLEIIKELLDNYGEGFDSKKTHKPCSCNQHQSQRFLPGNNLNIHFIH